MATPLKRPRCPAQKTTVPGSKIPLVALTAYNFNENSDVEIFNGHYLAMFYWLFFLALQLDATSGWAAVQNSCAVILSNESLIQQRPSADHWVFSPRLGGGGVSAGEISSVALTEKMLQVVQRSLEPEGTFYIRDVRVFAGAEGLAGWQFAPGYLRLIYVLSGQGPWVWPRRFHAPYQIFPGQILVFSGQERARAVSDAELVYYTLPAKNLSMVHSPWRADFAGQVLDVSEDFELLIVDLDLAK